MQVTSRHDEPFEELLARFKRGVARSGVLKDLKKSRFFVSPGEQRRLKAQEAVRKLKRRQRKTAARRIRG
jgi:ribosomal protein S21